MSVFKRLSNLVRGSVLARQRKAPPEALADEPLRRPLQRDEDDELNPDDVPTEVAEDDPEPKEAPELPRPRRL